MTERRILFLLREGWAEHVGGDVIQVLKTRDALKARGHTVHVASVLEEGDSSYDIVHITNLCRPYETCHFVKKAEKNNIPIAITPIYWDEHALNSHKSQFGRALMIAKILIKSGLCKIEGKPFMMRENLLYHMKNFYTAYQSRILNSVNAILPNSYAELDMMKNILSQKQNQLIRIIPSGYDHRMFNLDKRMCMDSSPQRKVLNVARIEERKNQLRLIRAMASTDIPVVLVGPVGDQRYAESVFAAMKSKDEYHGGAKYEELPSLYSSMYVHVLPSLWEACGLATMEAAAMGCNVVTSDIPTCREYYESIACLCDPLSEDSIRKSIMKAIQKSVPNELNAGYVRDRFAWSKVAEMTEDAYLETLKESCL
ncbi:MAG: glycosyltransferase [Clostridia bacterium]|nr:glycosyltransferase [Clostridia bacterium]